MANNYVLFSFAIAEISVDEETWIVNELRPGNEMEIDDDAVEEFCRQRCIESPGEWPGFQYDIANGSLYLFSEGGSNPDQTACFAQMFLARWRPDNICVFEVAYTCSRPRVGEFGGAAYLVSAQGIQVESTAQIVGEWLSDHE